MKRLALIMLMLGLVVGLPGRPAQAMVPSMAHLSMAKMARADMTAMPDCMASMAKDAKHKPCKCGMGGCVAMMASAAAMILANGPGAPLAVATGVHQIHLAGVKTLRGRSTAPEPEPPSA